MIKPGNLRTAAHHMAERCPAWNSRLAARRIGRFIDREVLACGLGAGQLGLMAVIASARDDTLSALAARAGLDPSTLSRNLRALARNGLVEITTAEKDLRRRAVWLTEKGARKLELAMPLWQEAVGKLERLVDPGPARELAGATEVLL